MCFDEDGWSKRVESLPIRTLFPLARGMAINCAIPGVWPKILVVVRAVVYASMLTYLLLLETAYNGYK